MSDATSVPAPRMKLEASDGDEAEFSTARMYHGAAGP
jgi:hypothetical protein